MPENSSNSDLHSYPVWDRTTRWFHWINALSILILIFLGVMILNVKTLGIPTDGKILLKQAHVLTGYIFVLNLFWRLIWGFIGGHYSLWRSILPIGRDYWRSFGSYIRGSLKGHPPLYLGHNPLARLMVSVLFILLLLQAITGLILAGTDLYYPPFGHEIAEQVTAAGEDHSKLERLRPGYTEGTNEAGYQAMREWRAPVIATHIITFYILLAAIGLHLLGVVFTELREGGALVSAMLTGRKYYSDKPVDSDKDE
ncbi:MAG: cytochrome b/b6 domain-containing protein [Gammaproteobacteria bacterium]|nr:cytochrome b/b6 domain-containing protein [Gammaproteobacteria bacterium]